MPRRTTSGSFTSSRVIRRSATTSRSTRRASSTRCAPSSTSPVSASGSRRASPPEVDRPETGRQVFPTQGPARADPYGLAGGDESWRPDQELFQGHARFEAGQRRTETEVDALPEREVTRRRARRLEVVRRVELTGVAVRRADHEQDARL